MPIGTSTQAFKGSAQGWLEEAGCVTADDAVMNILNLKPVVEGIKTSRLTGGFKRHNRVNNMTL